MAAGFYFHTYCTDLANRRASVAGLRILSSFPFSNRLSLLPSQQPVHERDVVRVSLVRDLCLSGSYDCREPERFREPDFSLPKQA